MKKIYLLFLILTASLYSKAWTIYFDAQGDTRTPNIWAWNEQGNCFQDNWPGPQMTKVGEAWRYVSTDGIPEPTKIKFSFNGANETGDYTFTDRGTFNKSGQVYLSGWKISIPGFYNGWDSSTNLTLEDNDPIAVWTYQSIGTYEFKILINYGGEDNVWYGTYNNIPTDTWVDCSGNEGTKNISINGAKSNSIYNVKFNTISHQIYVEEVPEKLYILGNIYPIGNSATQEWETKDALCAKNQDGIYTFDYVRFDSWGGYGYFNFTSKLGSWDDINTNDRYGASSSNKSLVSGQTDNYKVYVRDLNSSNCQSWKLPAGAYKITLNLKEGTLTAIKLDRPHALYVRGTNDDITNAKTLLPLSSQGVLTSNNEHVYYGKFDINGAFKITVDDNWNNVTYSPAEQIIIGETYEAIENNNSFTNASVPNADVLFYYNPNGKSYFVITQAPQSFKTFGKQYELPKQNINTLDFSNEDNQLPAFEDVVLSKTPATTPNEVGEFEYSARIPSGSALTGTFRVISADDNNLIYGVEGENDVVVSSTNNMGYVLKKDATSNLSLESSRLEGSDINFKYQPNSNLESNLIISGGTTTGVEGINNDSEAPVVYYNLQGVRVANPSHGLYIRVQGATSSKVFIK